MKYVPLTITLSLFLPQLLYGQSPQFVNCRTLEETGRFIGSDEVLVDGLVCKVVRRKATLFPPETPQRPEKATNINGGGQDPTSIPGADANPNLNTAQAKPRSSPQTGPNARSASPQTWPVVLSPAETAGKVVTTAKTLDGAPKPPSGTGSSTALSIKPAEPSSLTKTETSEAGPTLGVRAAFGAVSADGSSPKLAPTRPQGAANVNSSAALQTHALQASSKSSVAVAVPPSERDPQKQPVVVSVVTQQASSPAKPPTLAAPTAVNSKSQWDNESLSVTSVKSLSLVKHESAPPELAASPRAVANEQQLPVNSVTLAATEKPTVRTNNYASRGNTPDDDFAEGQHTGCVKNVSLASLVKGKLFVAIPEWAVNWYEKNQGKFPGLCFSNSLMFGERNYLIVFYAAETANPKLAALPKATTSAANASSGTGTFTASYGTTWHYAYEEHITTTITTSSPDSAPHNQPSNLLYARVYSEEGLPIAQHWATKAPSANRVPPLSRGKRREESFPEFQAGRELLKELVEDIARR